MALWQASAERLQQWQWIGMLLARLAVGLLFMLSGGGKLFSPTRREQMRQALIAARIPKPKISAFLVSLVLTAVMLAALSTMIVPGIKAQSVVSWLGDFLYLPEVLYVVMLVWLFFSGPGWLSLDHLILSSPGP